MDIRDHDDRADRELVRAFEAEIRRNPDTDPAILANSLLQIMKNRHYRATSYFKPSTRSAPAREKPAEYLKAKADLKARQAAEKGIPQRSD